MGKMGGPVVLHSRAAIGWIAHRMTRKMGTDAEAQGTIILKEINVIFQANEIFLSTDQHNLNVVVS